jgi:hypothetical protein
MLSLKTLIEEINLTKIQNKLYYSHSALKLQKIARTL